MPEILLIILINIIMIFLTEKLFYTSEVGSDHPLHISLINLIKNNKHRFCLKSPFQLNEQNFAYPQLFHWILSFFPESLYKANYKFINRIVKIIDILLLNLFLYYISNFFVLSNTNILIINCLYYLTPLSYATWNAKNSGLSPRGLGLVVGQLYNYLLIIFLFTNNLIILIPIALVILLSILLSQFTMQYIILSSLVISLLFHTYFLLITIPLVFLGYFLLFRKSSVNFLIGQYHHKRNYFLYLAEIYILPSRPSIYRDFIKDFWLKLKDNKLRACIYLYQNPIIEVLTGIPYLIILGYFWINNDFSIYEGILNKLILTGIIVFIMTSFRKTRFLGEPQRYLEYCLPFAVILIVVKLTYPVLLLIVFVSIIIIECNLFLYKSNRAKYSSIDNKQNLLDYLKEKDLSNIQTASSNDNDILKYLLLYNLSLIRPELTCYYPNKQAFTDNFYGNYSVIEPSVLNGYLQTYQVDILIINTNMYSSEIIKQKMTQLSNYRVIKEFGNFILFERNKLNTD